MNSRTGTVAITLADGYRVQNAPELLTWANRCIELTIRAVGKFNRMQTDIGHKSTTTSVVVGFAGLWGVVSELEWSGRQSYFKK